MAGIAKFFADKFHLTYVAGLWKENLISGLLWRRHHTTSTPVRFGQDVAPSWSWASIKGRLNYSNIKISASGTGANLRILGVDVEEDQPGSFGRVRYGKIHAERLMQKVVIDRSVHPTIRKRPYQECGIVEGVGGDAVFACMLDEYDESAAARCSYWCLQVGAYPSCGRYSSVFLLLEKADSSENQFRRVGLAEIDAWANPAYEANETYFFVCPEWLTFTLI
jgi:hypothetical protein